MTILQDDLNAEQEIAKLKQNSLYTITNNNNYDASTMSVAAKNL